MHEFPVKAHIGAHPITADFRSKLIRNQQVRGSSPRAGSKFPKNLAPFVSDPMAAPDCWQHIGSNRRHFKSFAAGEVSKRPSLAQTRIYGLDEPRLAIARPRTAADTPVVILSVGGRFGAKRLPNTSAAFGHLSLRGAPGWRLGSERL